MTTTIRAGLSILLLLGFYVLAFGLIAVLGWASVLLWTTHAGSGAAKLTYLTVVIAAGILIALWQVIRARPELPRGVPVQPDQAPELWQMVRELADAAKTQAPDEITLIPDVNAAVTEDAKLLGLIGGRRRLYLGVPLLQALTVAQLRSVLAHELGHYSGAHTRLAAISYRGRLAMQATVALLAGQLSGWIFKLYARVYFLVEAAVSRRQELEADEASVRASGRSVAQSALLELPVIEAAWGFYFKQYVEPGWDAGYVPRQLLVGFGQMLAARDSELAEIRAGQPPERASRWDSHPPIAARVAAMERMPEGTSIVDTRRAADLLPTFEQLCQAVEQSAIVSGDRRVVGWDELATYGHNAQAQRAVDQIYRATARLARVDQADLTTILGLVRSGRLVELAQPFFPEETGPAAAAKFAELMELVLQVAAVRSGVAVWQHSWTADPGFTRPDGSPLDLADVARQALDPDTVDAAQAHLSGLGIDLAQAAAVERVATADGAELIAALANVKVNGAPHDIVVLDNGLILVPCPKKTHNGKQRLIVLIQSAPIVELAKQHQFLPYEEVASATRKKLVPVRASLTLHDGRTFTLHDTWTGEQLTKESRDVLNAAINEFLVD